MRIPGRKAARGAAHWLHSRIADFILILGYHRVAETAVDPYDLCVRPDHFAGQMAVLQRKAQVIDLPALAEMLQSGNLPRRAVAITFDDGYLDILQTAKPLLAAHQLPATVFAVSGALGQEFWWDRLARMIYGPAVLPDSLTLPICGQTFAWSVMDTAQAGAAKDSPSPRRRLLDELYHRLAALPEERPFLLAQLEQWAETAGPIPPAASRAMTAEELQILAGDGLMTVGSHTVSHPKLTSLSPFQQQSELDDSRQTLTEILDRPITALSYPHGDNDAATRQMARQAGYQLACASQNGIVHQRQTPLALPRFWVSDWNGEQFGRWLARWIPD
jgi:peptidoglycan/xylan/chitin deacetylase (PgdA/CDA1 family)